MADIFELARAHVRADETVLAEVEGRTVTDLSRPKAALIATENRLLWYQKKMVGEVVASYPYSQVTGFGVSKGLMGKVVGFTSAMNVVKLERIKGSAVDDFKRIVESKLAGQ